jgi:hypothetical protein
MDVIIEFVHVKFIVNNINVYVFKQIYYENISYNEFNDIYFISRMLVIFYINLVKV